MFRSVRIGVAVIIGIAAIVFSADTQAAKSQTWVGRLVIDNGGGEDILHDCGAVEECEYTDHRWPLDNRRDPCVLGDVYSTGLAFFAVDRKFDNGLLCTEQPNAEITPRRFTVRIANQDVCDWFAVGPAPCNVTTDRNPIIRAETVFKNRATKTKVGFIWGWPDADNPDEHRTHRINTLQDATITGSTNEKVVTYNGPVTIFNLAGTMPQSTFQLAFTLLFKRQPL